MVPAYRKVLSVILIVGGAAYAVTGAFSPNGPARADIWTVAGILIAWGLAIWFQHVRLW